MATTSCQRKIKEPVVVSPKIRLARHRLTSESIPHFRRSWRKHKNVFLFRGWRNCKAYPSGGHQGLNTTTAVTPLAYLNRPASTVESVFDRGEATEAALNSMVLTHLTVGVPDEDQPPTQFSSWAASLAVAMSFARNPDAYIGVIDTKLLRKNQFVAYVPALDFLADSSYWPPYHWEYLAHGVIDDDCYKAIPLAKFTDIDFPNGPTWGAHPLIPDDGYSAPALPVQSELDMKQRWKDALNVARAFGTHHSLSIFLGLTCQKFKSSDYRADPKRLRKDIGSIACFVDRLRLHVPSDWASDPSIMELGVVESELYMDIKMMLMCMRLLVMDRYPVTTKKRWPMLSRETLLKEAKANFEFNAMNGQKSSMERAGDVAEVECYAGCSEWAAEETGWGSGEDEACAADWGASATNDEADTMADGWGATDAGWDTAASGWDTAGPEYAATSAEAGALDCAGCYW